MITIKRHDLIRTGMEGNGFHGVCKHCGLDCTTDLGWSSWDGVECIERPLTSFSEMSPEVKHYVNNRGYKLDKDLVFRRAYDTIEFTIEQMYEYVGNLKGDLMDAFRGRNEWITEEEYLKRAKLLRELGYNVYMDVSNEHRRKKEKEGLVQYSYYR